MPDDFLKSGPASGLTHHEVVAGLAKMRRAGRRTNLALLVLLLIAGGTGVLAYAVGTPRPARLVAVAHAVAGLALLLLVPWKSVIVRRGMARVPPSRAAGGRVEALILGAVVSVCLLAGFVHSLGGWHAVLGVTALQVHVGAAAIAVPFAWSHVRRRPQRVRRTDLSRRAALRTVLLGSAALGAYAAVQGATSLLHLPGRTRRVTGSHEVGSGHPELMPVTQWFTDTVQQVPAQSWELLLAYGSSRRSVRYGELSAGTDVLRATLDCTGGWYAEQDWRGVRLDRLLVNSGLASAGALGDLPSQGPRSVDIVSRTGYRRRFPLHDAPNLLLATSAGGVALSPGHGAPVRLVAPGRRGFWWVKWVELVELVDEPWGLQSPFPLQ